MTPPRFPVVPPRRPTMIEHLHGSWAAGEWA